MWDGIVKENRDGDRGRGEACTAIRVRPSMFGEGEIDRQDPQHVVHGQNGGRGERPSHFAYRVILCYLQDVHQPTLLSAATPPRGSSIGEDGNDEGVEDHAPSSK